MLFLLFCFFFLTTNLAKYQPDEPYLAKTIFLTDAAAKYGAVCLDGTPGVYYWADAMNERSQNKFLLYFEGGGWCNGIYENYMTGSDSCAYRINTDLGSNAHVGKSKNLNDVAMTGNNRSTNPMMYDWNKVVIKYCDGASYSGDLNEPILYNKSINASGGNMKWYKYDLNNNNNNNNDNSYYADDITYNLTKIYNQNTYNNNSGNDTMGLMYFRGKRIIDAVFDDLLLNRNLSYATDFVISGGSAGGLAVYLHTNYIVNKYFLSNNLNTKIVAMPDVGFFLQYNGYNKTYETNYTYGMKWIYENMNISSSILAPQCIAKYNNDSSQHYNCMFPQNIANNIFIDTFILNSQYDQWQADYILGTSIYDEKLLNEYGKNFTKLIINNFLNYSEKIVSNYDGNGNTMKLGRYGAYIDACFHHDASQPKFWYNLHIDNMTQEEAFRRFYHGSQKTFWYQNISYPCDKCCPNGTPGPALYTQVSNDDNDDNDALI